jgi:hypothetical protein
LDVLTAAGTSPSSATEERTTVTGAFAMAAAWLAGEQATTVIVDRAHLLRPAAFERLRDMARTAGATLYLMWSAEPGPRLSSAAAVFADPQTWDLPAFYRRVPLPKPTTEGVVPRRIYDQELPLVDFPLFLATARRRLHPDHFAHVREQFEAERAGALDLLSGHHRYGDDRFRHTRDSLIRYLREERIGPAPDGAERAPWFVYARSRRRAWCAACHCAGPRPPSAPTRPSGCAHC